MKRPLLITVAALARLPKIEQAIAMCRPEGLVYGMFATYARIRRNPTSRMELQRTAAIQMMA